MGISGRTSPESLDDLGWEVREVGHLTIDALIVLNDTFWQIHCGGKSRSRKLGGGDLEAKIKYCSPPK